MEEAAAGPRGRGPGWKGRSSPSPITERTPPQAGLVASRGFNMSFLGFAATPGPHPHKGGQDQGRWALPTSPQPQQPDPES